MNISQPLLTIGITSYKRINELRRCLNSIKTKYNDEIEILVSEDHSPLSKEISEMVSNYKISSKYRVKFISNSVNLGYDMNLGKIIQNSSGKFIFFLSDDDAVYENSLDNIIDFLRKEGNFGVLYSSFYVSSTNTICRYWRSDRVIPKGDKSVSKNLYDSILFSGLIFKKENIQYYDSSKFKNYNYFQVYLFMKMLKHYGGYYFKSPSVICIGDGENAYGISESSGGNELLANRKSVKSNLEFNKTLIKTIRLFDKEEGTNIIGSFAKQYSIHSYSGLSLARREGEKYFDEYWTMLNSLDIKLFPIVKIYYLMLRYFGYSVTEKLLYVFKKVLKREK